MWGLESYFSFLIWKSRQEEQDLRRKRFCLNNWLGSIFSGAYYFRIKLGPSFRWLFFLNSKIQSFTLLIYLHYYNRPRIIEFSFKSITCIQIVGYESNWYSSLSCLKWFCVSVKELYKCSTLKQGRCYHNLLTC